MPAKKAAKGKPKPAAKRAATSIAKPKSASPLIGKPDWRPATIDHIRQLIQQADPDAVEEVKWRKASNNMEGVKTWSHGGLICTGETYKDKVKVTFAKGAALPDPAGLFNADDTGATRRAIDLREGETVDPVAFKRLFLAAVALHAN